MTTQEQLTIYLQSALDKVTSKEVRQISDALRPILPDMVTLLHSIAASESSSMQDKKWALEMLLSVWRKCISTEHRAEKALTVRERARAKRIEAQAEDKRATLELAAERKRIDATLARAKAELESR